MIQVHHVQRSCPNLTSHVPDPIQIGQMYVKSCLATLNTIDGKAYKAFLQGRVTAWYALYPEVRPAPTARNSSVGSEDEEEAKDSGEEGPIGGSAPDLE